MNFDTQTTWVPPSSTEFPGTIWHDVTDRKKVIHRYWGALKVYLFFLLSRFPDYRSETEDFLQDFIMKKILQPGWLERANPGKGRFRDFLKSSLRHFVLGEIRNREAEKRGGKTHAASFDDLEQELADPEPSADSFDAAWARTLLAQAFQRMETGS